MVKKVYIRNSEIPVLSKSVACIGYFDGMHKGHQELIKKTVEISRKMNLIPSLICFSPDPVEVINAKETTHIFPDEERYRLAEYFGIERIIIIEFSETLMKLKAKDFINQYLNRMNIETLVCGYDFSFGYKGSGKTADLKKGKFETVIIPEKTYFGKKISSSRIKEEISEGNFNLVRKLLGFDYYLVLKVLKSSQNGSKWLIEAKPKDNKCILPKDGVYNDLFEIKNNHVFFINDKELKKNSTYILET